MLDLGGSIEGVARGEGGGGCWPAGGGGGDTAKYFLHKEIFGRQLSICCRKRVLIMTRGPCKLVRICGNSLSGHFGLRVK